MPVTSTARLNSSSTPIVSPRSNTSPTTGEPIVSPVTPGGPTLPSTLCAAAFAIACVPKPRLAFVVPPAIRIAPPFSANALAPMLIPVESASAANTVYSNLNVRVPVPPA